MVFGSQLSPVLMVCIILLGIGLLALELFIVSFGLLAAAGLACIVLGVALLLQAGAPPGTLGTEAALGRAISSVLGAVVLGASLFFGFLAVRTQLETRRRYRTSAQLSGPEGGLLDDEASDAEVVETVGPEKPGKIFFRGTLWSAQVDDEHAVRKGSPPAQPIAPGGRVVIVSWQGMTAVVRPAAKSASHCRAHQTSLHHTSKSPD